MLSQRDQRGPRFDKDRNLRVTGIARWFCLTGLLSGTIIFLVFFFLFGDISEIGHGHKAKQVDFISSNVARGIGHSACMRLDFRWPLADMVHAGERIRFVGGRVMGTGIASPSLRSVCICFRPVFLAEAYKLDLIPLGYHIHGLASNGRDNRRHSGKAILG